jgi:hypothetical protein
MGVSFNNISIKSLLSALMVGETGVA